VVTRLGRAAALVALGTIVSLALIVAAATNTMPERIGVYAWHPADTVQSRDHVVGMGAGRLDLTDISLAPGDRYTFTMSVSLGRLTVIVLAATRLEMRGATRAHSAPTPPETSGPRKMRNPVRSR